MASEAKRECPFCAEEIDASVTECPHCGEAVEALEAATIACPFCAEEIDASAATCPECGEHLSGRANALLARSSNSKKGMLVAAALATVLVAVAAVVVAGGGDDNGGSRTSEAHGDTKNTTTTLPTFTNSAATALLAHVPAEIAGTCSDEADDEGQGYLICNDDPAVILYEQYTNAFEMQDYFNYLAEEYGARAAGAPATAGSSCPYETTYSAGRVICYFDDTGITIDWTHDALLIRGSATIFKDNITTKDIERIHETFDTGAIQ